MSLSWVKLITSNSDAELNNITASANISASGFISASALNISGSIFASNNNYLGSSNFIRDNDTWSRGHISLQRSGSSGQIVVGALGTGVYDNYTPEKGYRFYLTNRASGSGTLPYQTQHIAILENGDVEIDTKYAEQSQNITGSAKLYVGGNILVSSSITASGNISASTYYGDGSNLTGIDKPRITYLYTSSISQAPSNAPTGYIDYADDIVDYILVNTSSYNGVDLDGSSTSNDFARFLYNEIGSIITIKKVGGSDFKSYKVTNVTTGGNSVRYDVISFSYGVSSGSISNGDEVEFIWDKSAGIGGAYGSQEGANTKLLANLLKPGYNYLDMFFGPQNDTEFDGSPNNISSVNGSGSFGNIQYFLPAISQSADLTVNSVTGSVKGDLVGTASYALTASYVEGGGGGGISFNGSTANGLVTYGNATTADVESNLTFDGTTLAVDGDASIKTINFRLDTDSLNDGYYSIGSRVAKDWSSSGPSLTAGRIVYLSGSKQWAGAIADSVSTSTGVLGVITNNNNQNEIVLHGVVIISQSLSGFTLGAPVYLATASAGTITEIPPSTTNHVARYVGYVLDPDRDTLYFNPDFTWIEL